MAKTLHIAVNDKVATYCQRDGVIVCGNSDYEIEFAFDSEWSSHAVKTARFIHGKTYEDVVFEGNTVAVPVMRGITSLAVGVFSGNLKTTTPALITCRKSVLCEGGSPSEPTPDVYAQIIDLLNKGGGGGSGNDGDVQTLEEMLQGFERDPGSVKAYVDSVVGGEGADGGHYTPSVADNGNGTMTVSFTASKDGMAVVSPVTVTLPKGADGAHVIAVDDMGGDDTKTTYKMLFSDGSHYDFDVYHGHDGDDGVGIASVVQTTTSTDDGGENIITVTLTNGNNFTFAVKNGSKGNPGDAGEDGKDGTNGKDGANGADGVGIKSIVKTATSGLVDTYTITLTNNATATFTVTNGKAGTNGTSVTITSVTESPASGGENVVEFSDGKKLTIINGSDGRDGIDGDDGRTPVKGVDYFTPVEIDNIRNEIGAELSQIPTPPIVSSVAEMTDVTKHYVLQSSGHIYAARTIQTGGEVIKTPNFTNLFDKAAVTLNAYIGGTDNAAEDGSFVTGLMPFDIKTLAVPQVIRIANWYNDIGYHKRNKIAWYPNGAYNTNCVDQLNTHAYVLVDSSNLDLQTITCQAGKIPNTNTATTSTITGFKLSFRAGASAITLNDIPDDMIITVNEEITYTETTTPIETITEWYDTGISYSPTFKTDLVGVMGENNVIYLSDNLPSGTYTLVDPDNNYATVGTITR